MEQANVYHIPVIVLVVWYSSNTILQYECVLGLIGRICIISRNCIMGHSYISLSASQISRPSHIILSGSPDQYFVLNPFVFSDSTYEIVGLVLWPYLMLLDMWTCGFPSSAPTLDHFNFYTPVVNLLNTGSVLENGTHCSDVNTTKYLYSYIPLSYPLWNDQKNRT